MYPEASPSALESAGSRVVTRTVESSDCTHDRVLFTHVLPWIGAPYLSSPTSFNFSGRQKPELSTLKSGALNEIWSGLLSIPRRSTATRRKRVFSFTLSSWFRLVRLKSCLDEANSV